MRKWIEYPYKAQLSPDGLSYRPVLDVEISSGDNLRIINALVDSGTDTLILNSEFAESLGIDPARCEKRKIDGINGSNIGFRAEIYLKVPPFREKIRAHALFLENTPFAALLGQRDFFILFKLDSNIKIKNSFLRKHRLRTPF